MDAFTRFEIWPLKKRTSPYLEEMARHVFGNKIQAIEDISLFWISGVKLSESEQSFIGQEVLSDDVVEIAIHGEQQELPKRNENLFIVETSYRPGVTDNSAKSTKEAIQLCQSIKGDFHVSSGKLFLVEADLNQEEKLHLAQEVLANKLLQNVKLFSYEQFINSSRFSEYHFPEVKLGSQAVGVYDLDVSDEALEKMSQENTWALTLKEMKEVREHYQNAETQEHRKKKGLPLWPTDVEMEVIAQTWSEHCKHKIFSSHINYSEKESKGFKSIGHKKIKSLFKDYIKKVTDDVTKKRNLDWLVSVFTDNAGIMRFDKNLDVCVKVETHNSPSALDPYGGAITGILGVNRDILGCGIGARPIANTDVFCFADPKLMDDQRIKIPEGLKHPAHIFDGVHKGVEDGGNKSGIPTVNGAIHFDDNYAGKPLVYCGTVGVMPQEVNGKPTHLKGQRPGDLIVMIGGAIGADGIHGATFSSMELTEGAPATVVQIGDPITQKRVMDFLMEARDKGLYNSLTDNGAGGLSSSIGEMAEESNGAEIDLKKAHVKYPGLSPFELLISESQERMSLSVPEENIEDFLALASKRGVDCDVLGKFTDSEHFTVYYGDELVADLNLHFLHESLIPMDLQAVWEGPKKKNNWHGINLDKKSKKEEVLCNLLQRPNIMSKEKWVRQYDHEVQAATVIKPFTGPKTLGPSDAAVIWMAPHGGEEKNALAISCGLCPQYSHIDSYLMAQYAIDEAVRNAVASGADPERCALVDNFCWPDPIESQKTPDGSHKLAQLLRACEGLYDMAFHYGMPFVSGKDSMKNDFHGKFVDGEKVKISVEPTLLITAVSQLADVEKVVSTEFKKNGDIIYLLSSADYKKVYYGEYSHMYLEEILELAPIDIDANFKRYQKVYQACQNKLLSSCHDVSDGGALVSLSESFMGSAYGAKVSFDGILKEQEQLEALRFNEVTGSFILSCSPENCEKLESLFGAELRKLGTVIQEEKLVVDEECYSKESLIAAWRSL